MVAIGRKAMLGVIGMLLLVLPACEFTDEYHKTTVGAGIGAAGGAVAGGLTEGTKGAIVGGLLGALAGGAIGYYLDSEDRDAEGTDAEYHYRPAHGIRLEINER